MTSPRVPLQGGAASMDLSAPCYCRGSGDSWRQLEALTSGLFPDLVLGLGELRGSYRQHCLRNLPVVVSRKHCDLKATCACLMDQISAAGQTELNLAIILSPYTFREMTTS